jgi:hypothetical protein
MALYRCFLFDRRLHALGSDEFEAQDDDLAIAEALRRLERARRSHGLAVARVELWAGTRLVWVGP